MKTWEIIVGKGTRYEIVLQAVECGNDLNVSLCGGTRHHVGAVALAYPKGISGKEAPRSAKVSVICVKGHRDDVIAKAAANYLATAINCHVSVAAGVHIDAATQAEIKILLANCTEACTKFINLRAFEI